MLVLTSTLDPAERAWASAILASVGESLGSEVDKSKLRAIIVWKDIEDRRVALEKQYAKKLAIVLASVGSVVSSTYLSSQDPDKTVRVALREMTSQLVPALKAMYNDVERIFGSETVRRVVPGLKSSKADEDELYDPLEDPIIRAWNTDRLATRIRNVSEATQARVRVVVTEAFAEGYTVPEIADIISSMYHFSARRALVIARTEIVACGNAANHFSIGRHLNVTRLTKQWLSTMDRRTRHSHAEAHGQTKSYNRPFSVGGSALMFPGDGSLGASGKEIIQCRCTATYSRV